MLRTMFLPSPLILIHNFSAFLPFFVSLYRCKRLFGFSGIVYSINPIFRAGWDVPATEIVTMCHIQGFSQLTAAFLSIQQMQKSFYWVNDWVSQNGSRDFSVFQGAERKCLSSCREIVAIHVAILSQYYPIPLIFNL